ncbi:hypothetical protein FKM82_020691 [Ascaphus truei]
MRPAWQVRPQPSNMEHKKQWPSFSGSWNGPGFESVRSWRLNKSCHLNLNLAIYSCLTLSSEATRQEMENKIEKIQRDIVSLSEVG